MLIFSAFAILIACLGLFGLSSFLAEQKTREVGIRKIMGASVLRITTHLSIEFTRWVLIANIIAWPAAYFIMKRWLENFAYHVNIPWLVFFLALIISLAIAVFTVSFQTIRSAFRNPVEAIKYE
jgi:putative ABC transport system permease protein